MRPKSAFPPGRAVSLSGLKSSEYKKNFLGQPSPEKNLPNIFPAGRPERPSFSHPLPQEVQCPSGAAVLSRLPEPVKRNFRDWLMGHDKTEFSSVKKFIERDVVPLKLFPIQEHGFGVNIFSGKVFGPEVKVFREDRRIRAFSNKGAPVTYLPDTGSRV